MRNNSIPSRSLPISVSVLLLGIPLSFFIIRTPHRRGFLIRVLLFNCFFITGMNIAIRALFGHGSQTRAGGWRSPLTPKGGKKALTLKAIRWG